jgi:hypothetical protein
MEGFMNYIVHVNVNRKRYSVNSTDKYLKR